MASLQYLCVLCIYIHICIHTHTHRLIHSHTHKHRTCVTIAQSIWRRRSSCRAWCRCVPYVPCVRDNLGCVRDNSGCVRDNNPHVVTKMSLVIYSNVTCVRDNVACVCGNILHGDTKISHGSHNQHISHIQMCHVVVTTWDVFVTMSRMMLWRYHIKCGMCSWQHGMCSWQYLAWRSKITNTTHSTHIMSYVTCGRDNVGCVRDNMACVHGNISHGVTKISHTPHIQQKTCYMWHVFVTMWRVFVTTSRMVISHVSHNQHISHIQMCHVVVTTWDVFVTMSRMMLWQCHVKCGMCSWQRGTYSWQRLAKNGMCPWQCPAWCYEGDVLKASHIVTNTPQKSQSHGHTAYCHERITY